MNDTADSVVLQRFLDPRHAVAGAGGKRWRVSGAADTPGEDAYCRLYLATGDGCDCTHLAAAGFAAFGPPVVIACADWACERLARRTVAEARSLAISEFERALALAPGQRYAALLVTDALASALVNLES